MAELDRIKGNISKMIAQDAPEADIDAYVASEGVSLDQIKSHRINTVTINNQAPDRGTARRLAMSPAEKLVSPITEFWPNQVEISNEARHQAERGLGQIGGAISSNEGLVDRNWEVLKGIGNIAGGALGWAGSPITAAARSLLGNPVEDVTGIPREYTEFAAQLATPGIGFSRMPGRPGVPDIPYRGPTQPPPPAPTPTTPAGLDAGLAAQRLREMGLEGDVPRSITSDALPVRRGGQMLSNTPVIGDPLARSVHEVVPQQMERNVGKIADVYGGGDPRNVADRAANVLREGATAETTAAEAAVAERNAQAQSAWERANAEREAKIAAYEQQSRQAAEAQTGNVDPQVMADRLRTRLQTGEQEARAEKNRLYADAKTSDATVDANAVKGVRDYVNRTVHGEGVRVDPGTSVTAGETPKSRTMLKVLDDFTELKTPGNMVAPAAAGGEQAQNVSALRARYGDDVAAAYERQSQASAPKPAADVPAGPAAPNAQSLTEFLASGDGLGPHPELNAIGADRHVPLIEGVGRRKMVKQGGLDLDYAREAAEEAGYLPKGSTPRDLLDAIETEVRGQKRYPAGAEGSMSKRETAAMSDRQKYEYERHVAGLEQDLAEAGHGNLGPDVKQRAIKLMESEKLDPDTAVEHALRQLEQEDAAIGGSFPGDNPTPNGPPSVSIHGIEDVRKHLRSISEGAETPTDQRAAASIMRAFDKWEQNAFDQQLFSGSTEGLDAIKRARAANRDLMQRFGYNAEAGAEGAADRILNQIATGDVTTTQVANWLIGSGKVGEASSGTQLLRRIAAATRNDPEALQAIRGGVWNRLTTTASGNKEPLAVAKEIDRFLRGEGRPLAQELYTAEQRQVMQAYANSLRTGQEARGISEQIAKGSTPVPEKATKGPLQQLTDKVVGKGMKADEAIFTTIKGYAQEKGGDIKALAKVMRELPQEMKGDIAASFVNGLGRGGKNEFSLDKFATDWKHITPQAKSIIFGNAGEHVKALDDIALIGRRIESERARYGNPSGTAQTAAGQKIWAVVTGIAAGQFAPLTAALAAVGAGAGFGAAKVLASPAGAASLARAARAAERAAQAPTKQNQVAARLTQRNLENTVRSLAVSRGTQGQLPGGLPAIQGPMPARSEEKRP